MSKEKTASKKKGLSFQRYILTGILTVIPLAITWVVFDIFLSTLSSIGSPWVRAFALSIKKQSPMLSEWLLSSNFQSVLAVLLTLIALYILGWATTHVIGRRTIRLFDSIVAKIPIVKEIYGSTKKFLQVIQTDPDREVQRVVLIDFPSDSMKTVGFVTTVLEDDVTGQKLAAVYVPTTPNPTSGYLEIVPVDKLVPTNWEMDEAMTFIISGGAVAPDKLSFQRKPDIES